MPRYYEDVEIGEPIDCGSYELSKAEIVAFAEQYDPQPFHIDEEAASDSFFGGLVASGWQTACLCMRQTVEHMGDRKFVGARGVDELRWIQPLRPGDTLSVESEVVAKHPNETYPSIGNVTLETIGHNQRDEPVISYRSLGMMERREPTTTEPDGER